MKILLEETALPIIAGDLIRASLEQLRLKARLLDRSDSWNWGMIDCLTMDCWLKELLKYISQHNFQLINTLPILLYIDSDKFLMMEFLAHGYFKKDLQILNECWKYLHVTTLAKISLEDGSSLEA